jgi:mxaK protein
MVVRRRWVHLGFGAVAVAFAAVAALEGTRLREAQQVNAVIAGQSDVIANSEIPEARFTLAMAQAKRGEYDAALKAYKALGRDASTQLATAALYNAGNLQLRVALKEGPDAAIRALPLIELAKQSYRAALRRDPLSWDARYNLERALWLAPEVEQSATDRIRRDAEERVMSTLQSTRGELP